MESGVPIAATGANVKARETLLLSGPDALAEARLSFVEGVDVADGSVAAMAQHDSLAFSAR